MSLVWSPLPGDRVLTVVSKDGTNEVVYLNGEHVIDSLFSNEFLIFTSEWLPWPHQIIDQLSRVKGLNRRKLLERLIVLDLTNSELDFDQLCIKLLASIEDEKKKASETGFASTSQGYTSE